MNENGNLTKTYEVMPERNSKAVSSLVLSIVGLILSPLMILQILGLILGIRGLKSEKKGISIAGIVISSIGIILGILLIISIIAFNYFGAVLQSSKEIADVRMSYEIKQAIVTYISQSNDMNLQFDEKNSNTVDEIIDNLQTTVTIDGVDYGPYLLNEGKSYIPNNASGWSIHIDKSENIVSVEPSEDGDSVYIK